MESPGLVRRSLGLSNVASIVREFLTGGNDSSVW